jgi:hypothetical protein
MSLVIKFERKSDNPDTRTLKHSIMHSQNKVLFLSDEWSTVLAEFPHVFIKVPI